MTKVKICGIRDAETALYVARAGADYIGLVFASSRRRISPDKALEIAMAVGKVESRPKVIGVFVDEEPDEVNRLAGYCKLDGAQLSGGEAIDYCLKIRRPVIRVIQVSPESRAEGIIKEIGKTGSGTIRYMLDTRAGSYGGGSGITFDWRIASRIAARFPIMVAGGLTPENVTGLIEQVKPWGVDVSSGVETDGMKDRVKISQFIDAVRQADQTTKQESEEA